MLLQSVVLAMGVSGQFMPNYNTYYQNNAVLIELVASFEGNLSAANDIVSLPITHIDMANQMTPHLANMNASVKAISLISQERTNAWKLAKFHMARREKFLTKYYLEQDETVKALYQSTIKESDGNLTKIFELAHLDPSDLALAFTAHISYFPLKEVYLNLGALWARKRDRAANVQKLIDYLRIY